MTRTERGTCARCGERMWMYHGTDGDFWVHDDANSKTLTHLATDKVPDVVAEVADERRKEYHTETGPSYWPDVDPMPEDDVLYDQDNWHPEGLQ